MHYLTAQHKSPPSVIEHDGTQYPVARLIEFADTATLALLGVYPHIYNAEPAPLGTEWQYNDTLAQWEQIPLGTEAERAAIILKQRWAAQAQQRKLKQAEVVISDPLDDTETQRRVEALNTLRGGI